MTVRAKGGLSISEVRQLEADLVARGYHAMDENAWEIGIREYRVNRYPEKTLPDPRGEKYSICWRN